MRSSVAIALTGVVACLHPSYETCGDLICPEGTVCVGGTICGTQDQLAACEGATDGAICHASIGDGYCVDGVCTPNVCGDGQVTGIEQCDGSDVPTTCEDIGYYGGTATCSIYCELDQSTCAGRCGDGIVQAGEEDCDGAPPAFDCTDIGYDYGALTCSHRCAANPVGSCSRYGWENLGPVMYNAVVVGDAGGIAVRDSNGIVVTTAAGTVLTHPGAFVGHDMRGTSVIAATTTTVDELVAGSWTTLPAPTLPPGLTISEATIGEDGTPFVLATAAATCEIGTFDGTSWSFATGPSGGCAQLLAIGAGNYAVVDTSGSVHWTWPGCSQTIGDPCQCGRSYPAGNPGDTVFGMHPTGDVLTVAFYQVAAHVVSQTVVPECGSGPSSFVIASVPTFNQGHFAMRDDGPFIDDGQMFGGVLYHGSISRTDTLSLPSQFTGAPRGLFVTHDGQVYSDADSTLYRLGALTQTNRVPPAELVFAPQPMSLAEDGSIATCGTHVWQSNNATWATVGSLVLIPDDCFAFWAQSTTTIYVDALQSGMSTGLFKWTGSTWQTQTYADTTPVGRLNWLAGHGSTVVALRNGDNAVLYKSGGSWIVTSALPTSCTAATLAVGPDSTIYAAGACTMPAQAGVLWTYDPIGDTWTEQYREAGPGFSSVSAAVDGTLFVATSARRIAIETNGTWLDYDGAGGRVAALSATEAYSVDGTNTAPSRVRRWDGSRWTPIETDPANVYYSLGVSKGDVIMYGARAPTPTGEWLSFIRGY